jgi:hypothetical protein
MIDMILVWEIKTIRGLLMKKASPTLAQSLLSKTT